MKKQWLATVVAATLVSGCGSDSSNSNGGGDLQPPVPGPTSLNLSVIDRWDLAQRSVDDAAAPMRQDCHHDKCLDDLEKVNIAFNYVFLKPIASLPGEEETCDQTGECEPYHVYFEDQPDHLRMLEVKDANGGSADVLFEGLAMSPGTYEMCLYINGKYESGVEPNVRHDSHVVEHSGVVDHLTTPSQGACAGAKPPSDVRDSGRLVSQRFDIVAGDNNLAVLFDLENSLQYNKNNGWRFLGNKNLEIRHVEREYGDILGTVAGTEVRDQCLRERGSSVEAVYLYPHNTAAHEMLGYYSRAGATVQNRPLADALLVTSEGVDNLGHFSFHGVEAGEYNLGYSCTTQNDTPEIEGDGFRIHASLGGLQVEGGVIKHVAFE
ncbi:hypothetical protein [Ferrimonas pelagia]|uniref:Lipoprotein n=1 Tax=Ferrimonas pelagia TaxID=1177826 RepID=A0ABP9EZE5_9GAMM